MANSYIKDASRGTVVHRWNFDSDGVGQAVGWTGGWANFVAADDSDFGIGTLTLQVSPDGGSNWGDVEAVSQSSPIASGVDFYLKPCQIRTVMTDSSTTPAVVCFVW